MGSIKNGRRGEQTRRPSRVKAFQWREGRRNHQSNIFITASAFKNEWLNTAIEALADYVQPNRDPRIGHLKDISAGAVLIGSIASCIVGLIIYLPKIFS